MKEKIDLAGKKTVVVPTGSLSGYIAVRASKLFLPNATIVSVYDGRNFDVSSIEGTLILVGYSVSQTQRREIEANKKIKRCVYLRDRIGKCATVVYYDGVWRTYLEAGLTPACKLFLSLLVKELGYRQPEETSIINSKHAYYSGLIELTNVADVVQNISNWTDNLDWGTPEESYERLLTYIDENPIDEFVIDNHLYPVRYVPIAYINENHHLDEVKVGLYRLAEVLQERTIEHQYIQTSSRIMGTVIEDGNDFVVSLYSPVGLEYNNESERNILHTIAKAYGGESGDRYCNFRVTKESWCQVTYAWLSSFVCGGIPEETYFLDDYDNQ